MKKSIVLLIFLFLAAASSSVLAGSIEDLNYKDYYRAPTFWYQINDADRQVDDDNVQITADYLGASTEEDIYTSINEVQENLDNKPDQVGGGGISSSALGIYLFKDEDWFYNHGWGEYSLFDTFVTREEFYAETDLLQAQINLLAGGQKLTSDNVHLEFKDVQERRKEYDKKYICYVGSTCFVW